MSRSSPARQGDQQGESSIVPGDRLRSAAEAILVVADEPVTTAALSEALGLEETATEALLESLAVEYSGHDGTGRSRGFVLRRAAGGWRLASAPEFSEIVERFVVGGATARLSQAALETLAVIASVSRSPAVASPPSAASTLMVSCAPCRRAGSSRRPAPSPAARSCIARPASSWSTWA